MLIFNLTKSPLNYRGVVLKPDGGSYDFRDISFLPDRDMELVKNKVISLNHLPKWWVDSRTVKSKPVSNPIPTAVPVAVEDRKAEQSKDFKKR